MKIQFALIFLLSCLILQFTFFGDPTNVQQLDGNHVHYEHYEHLTDTNELVNFPGSQFSESPNYDNSTYEKNDNNDNKINEKTNSHVPSSAPLPSSVALNQLGKVQWDQALHDFGLDQLHQQGFNGTNVRIGIVDNGVDLLHPGFADRGFIEKSFAPALNQSTQTHGTSVAGIIFGDASDNFNHIPGTAPNATCISAEMGSTTNDRVILGNFTAAFEWLILNQTVDIINTSFGGISNWTNIINLAKVNNVIIVGSAGNDGGPPSGPGADPYSIGVGSMTPSKFLEPYSAGGLTAHYIQKPETVGYGTIETTSVVSGTTVPSGTSFAAPQITGGIASVISAAKSLNVAYSPSMIKAALINSSNPIIGKSQYTGAGHANFSKMLDLLIEANTTSSDIQQIFPSELHHSEFSKIPSGLEISLPLQVIAQDTLDITITGNISNVLVLDLSTEFPFSISQGPVGSYSGEIKLYYNSALIQSIPITLYLYGQFHGFVGFDYRHNAAYSNGEENLLNSNPIASNLRDIGYWPEYILSDFDTIDLSRFSIVFIIDPFNVQRVLQDDTVRSYFSQKELTALNYYRDVGGNILYAFEQPSFTVNTATDPPVYTYYGGEPASVESLLSHYNMKSEGLIKQQPLSPHYLLNVSSYAQHTTSLYSAGGNIDGGHSMFQYNSGMVYQIIAQSTFVASSSIDFLLNRGFMEDLLYFMDYNKKISIDQFDGVGANSTQTFANLLLSSNNISDVSVSLEYENFAGVSTLEQVQPILTPMPLQYNYSVFLQEEGKYSFFVTLLSDPLRYWQFRSSDFTQLIVDWTPPEIHFIPNQSQLLLNQSNNMTAIKLVYSFFDNNEIEHVQLYFDNQVTTRGIQLLDDYLTFSIFSSDFSESSSELNVIVLLFDVSGNQVAEDTVVYIERPSQPPSPPYSNTSSEIPSTFYPIHAEDPTVNMTQTVLLTIIVLLALIGLITSFLLQRT